MSFACPGRREGQAKRVGERETLPEIDEATIPASTVHFVVSFAVAITSFRNRSHTFSGGAQFWSAQPEDRGRVVPLTGPSRSTQR